MPKPPHKPLTHLFFRLTVRSRVKNFSMRRNEGFTIVELVIAAALFAVVIASAVNLFVIALRTPLRQVDEHHLYEEVTYVFEQLAYYTHHSTINYTTYGTITNPTNTLYLLANDGTNDSYRFYASAGRIYLDVTTAGVTTTLPLTSDPAVDVSIDTMQFYIYPTADPFEPTNNNNNQPAVMAQISGHNVENTDVTFDMQSLISTRIYER